MFNLVIIVAVVLIIAIVYTIFRVTTLISIAKGESSNNVPSSNKTHATLFILFLIAGLGGFFYYSFGGLDDSFIQPIASKHGVETDFWFWVTMGVTCFVFIVTHILLFGFSYKYQHDKDRSASFYPHNNKLELIWTAVPAIVLAFLVLTGWKIWTDITGPAPEEAYEIEVFGYQYGWSFRYPGKDGKLGDYDYRKIDKTGNDLGIDLKDRASHDDFISNQLHIPKGKPVLLKIRARDVIHSVYMPQFRAQMNAVPGLPTKFWFEPTKSTADMRIETGNPDFNFELVCNKICGRSHFGMKATIVVDEHDEFKDWYKDQEAWLKLNPDYLSQVPENLKEVAIISAELENIDNNQSVGNSSSSF